jgi:hypothetical protein
MRLILSIVIALATGGCGRLVDSDYPGPPLARIRCGIKTTTFAPVIGLLWNLDDTKLGNRYAVTSLQPPVLGDRTDIPVDIYSEMPGRGELGYAFVALFDLHDGTQFDIAGSTFTEPTTLRAVDTKHVLLFARSRVTLPPGGIVWPRNIVVDNPEQLLGPGYHVAEVRCGPDGAAQQPMHVALLDEPLDRDEARPRFDLVSSTELAGRSDAVGGIPLGPVPNSCLVLP